MGAIDVDILWLVPNVQTLLLYKNFYIWFHFLNRIFQVELYIWTTITCCAWFIWSQCCSAHCNTLWKRTIQSKLCAFSMWHYKTCFTSFVLWTTIYIECCIVKTRFVLKIWCSVCVTHTMFAISAVITRRPIWQNFRPLQCG